jgi:hypothetical protein
MMKGKHVHGRVVGLASSLADSVLNRQGIVTKGTFRRAGISLHLRSGAGYKNADRLNFA